MTHYKTCIVFCFFLNRDISHGSISILAWQTLTPVRSNPKKMNLLLWAENSFLRLAGANSEVDLHSEVVNRNMAVLLHLRV